MKKDKYIPPPSGGREKGGGERTEGRRQSIKKEFYEYRGIHELEGFLETIRDAFVTPHPDPLPQGEREDNF
jgi:hypothetical protein